MKRVSALWLFIGMAGCQSAPIQMEKANGVFHGENLLQHFPFPEFRWQGRSGDKDGTHIAEWQSDTGEGFQTFIFFGDKKMERGRFHEIDVTTGQKNCAKFTTEFVDAPEQPGYPSGTWIGRCEHVNGSMRVVLNKVIRGKDSFYNLKMIWKSEPSAESLDKWKKYMASVTVCDTRSSAAPCPATMPTGIQQ